MEPDAAATRMPATLRRLLRYGWASPCTTVGVLLALPLLCRHGSCSVRGGLVEIVRAADAERLFGRFGAITFGHVVLAASPPVLDRLREHERAHVRQYERWGLLFFVAYPLASLSAWLAGGDPHRDNRFERQARRQCEALGPDA